MVETNSITRSGPARKREAKDSHDHKIIKSSSAKTTMRGSSGKHTFGHVKHWWTVVGEIFDSSTKFPTNS